MGDTKGYAANPLPDDIEEGEPDTKDDEMALPDAPEPDIEDDTIRVEILARAETERAS